ncbi:hypothetical protein L6E12_03785 [Actinokineospora sp. PR83]|uniref:hypothetical protein n=1 Tax=Actinokineospora sp. PR83 TaxID=2884908 RepID=UPI001F251172|nr:hypothetical protein [Actinokineospora sp. PR83]MCG8914910.1 hypothetical protein [Actinokineospora sp. PR83]
MESTLISGYLLLPVAGLAFFLGCWFGHRLANALLRRWEKRVAERTRVLNAICQDLQRRGIDVPASTLDYLNRTRPPKRHRKGRDGS